MQKPIFLVWFILIELLTNATHSKNPGLKSRITSKGFTYGKRWKKVLLQTNKIIRFQYLKQFFIKLKNLIKIHVMIDVHLLKKCSLWEFIKMERKGTSITHVENTKKVFPHCSFYNIFICSCKRSIRCPVQRHHT